MRILYLAVFVLCSTLSASAFQSNTTLAAESGNNTSASSSFAGQTNGNEAATNVSKLPIRSLLYPGATTKIYAHLMPWFGTSSHVNVGYDSNDPAQASRQIADMASRGIDGVIVDWYGPNSTHHNTAAKYELKAAEQTPNFEFAICEDWGAVKNSTDPTQQTINDLNYAWQTFMPSPAYMRQNGRPVIFFFGFEGQLVDIAAIKAAMTFNPIFVFRNSGGFSKASSDGSFSWLAPKTTSYDDYMSMPYLDDFYATGLKYPVQSMFGSGFKGFDDTIASWAPPGGRHVPQFCGQTWLKSMAETAKYFSENNQLPALQIVTWNDYEEGTAIEPGIDNCVSITAWMSGSRLNWSITGLENTIDHYTVFASLDGTSLAKVGEFAAGSTGADLDSLSLASADYQFFVKAVGKASMANHMSGAVAYSVGIPVAATADYAMTLTPLAVQVARGSTATVQVGVNSVNSAFTSSVALSCGNLPTYMSCSFSNPTIVPGATGASSILTIAVLRATARSGDPFGWTVLPAFGFVVVLGAGLRKRARAVPKSLYRALLPPGEDARLLHGVHLPRNRSRQIAFIAGLLLLAALGVGCGGGTSTAAASMRSSQAMLSPGIYTITITAASGNLKRMTTATVTVQ